MTCENLISWTLTATFCFVVINAGLMLTIWGWHLTETSVTDAHERTKDTVQNG